MQEYVSVKEAAERLGLSPQTVYRMLWRGDIPTAVRVGGSAVRIPAGALLELPKYERGTKGE